MFYTTLSIYFLLVTLRIGGSSESKSILCTRLNLMIWFFTKMGIVLNNKLKIVSQCCTMMGRHFFPKIHALLPKESNLSKLLLICGDKLRKRSRSLKILEKFSGKFNWLRKENCHTLQPFFHLLVNKNVNFKLKIRVTTIAFQKSP